jgi:cell division protein FtsZ
VKGIAELITVAGLINVDFADVRTVMSNAGTALMGIGIGSGDKRAMSAIKQAISSPLLDVSIEGARGILFNVVGGPDLTMSEIDEAASIIAKTVDPDADIIFGAVIDEKLMDQIKITLIATKFDENRLKIFRYRKDLNEEPSMLNKQEDKSSESLKTPEPALDEFSDDEFSADDEGFDIPAFLRKK